MPINEQIKQIKNRIMYLRDVLDITIDEMASQLGITKVLDTVNGAKDAIRGDIFLMAWETLLQNQWGAIGFNDLGEISYGNLNKTLLESK